MAKLPEVAPEDVDALADYLIECEHDPFKFVMLSFPWGEPGTPLADKTGPDQWQKELLNAIKDGLKTPDEVIRTAVASGHGIGKSTLVAWLILWGLSTCVEARGVVTANTEDQLRGKTWPELAKWYQMWIAKDFFVYTATAIFSAGPEREKTWRFDAVTWSKTNTEAFAGLHNEGKRVMLIFDEASGIDPIVWEVAEGAMTDDNTEIIWCAFGNPTRNSGRFYDCFHKHRDSWRRWQIDSRSVAITNKRILEEWRQMYGEDSDFFKVRVRGVFPSASDLQFIGTELVEEARKRTLKESQFDFAPVIIGMDPAWTGADALTIYLRQGLYCKRLLKVAKNENDIEVAGILARLEDEHHADAVFIDLGYGTGIKSAGDAWGRNWTLIAFGGKSTRPDCKNKRAAMWADMKDWLRNGGVLPYDDQELADDLCGPETVPNTSGLIQLESKDKMRERGQQSPNCADALALTFAQPVLSRKQIEFEQQTQIEKYDPFKGM